MSVSFSCMFAMVGRELKLRENCLIISKPPLHEQYGSLTAPLPTTNTGYIIILAVLSCHRAIQTSPLILYTVFLTNGSDELLQFLILAVVNTLVFYSDQRLCKLT